MAYRTPIGSHEPSTPSTDARGARLHADRAPRRDPDHRHPRRDRHPVVPEPEEQGHRLVGKELARTAQTTAETYATDHNGSYAGISPEELKKYEPTIQIAAGGGNAYLSAATGTETTYKVTAQSVTANHSFTIERLANGEIKRSCTPTGKTGFKGGGCQNSTW